MLVTLATSKFGALVTSIAFIFQYNRDFKYNFYIYYVYMLVCVCVQVCMRASVCAGVNVQVCVCTYVCAEVSMWRSEDNLWEKVLSFPP